MTPCISGTQFKKKKENFQVYFGVRDHVKVGSAHCWIKKKLTALGIPRRSPIQVHNQTRYVPAQLKKKKSKYIVHVLRCMTISCSRLAQFLYMTILYHHTAARDCPPTTVFPSEMMTYQPCGLHNLVSYLEVCIKSLL